MASPSQAQRTYGPTYSQGGAVFNGDLNAARDININHITTIRPFARSLYRSCLTSSEFFKQIQNELALLSVVLETTEDSSKEFQFDADRHPQLCHLSRDCYKVLQDLKCLKTRFDAAGSQTQLTWERMGWGADELADIRLRLMSYTSTITMFNTNIINSSQVRIEQMLRTFIDEVRTGKREGSVSSIQTTGSLSDDEKEAWRQLRKELESVGITPVLFTKHRAFIVATLQKAIMEEDLAGDLIVDSCEYSRPAVEGSRKSSRSRDISPADPVVENADESQQPTRDRTSSEAVPHRDSPRRSKNIGRMARLLYKITNSGTALHEAAVRGDVTLTGRLLDKGAAVDCLDGKGRTPLVYAVAKDHDAVVKLLLENGADANLETIVGTILVIAAGAGREAIVKLLLDHGASVDWQGSCGFSPLFGAAHYGHDGVVKLLLNKGATVDLKNNDSRTPLFIASAKGHEGVVKLLLDNGAAVDGNWINGHTQLLWAAMEGHDAVVKLLLDKGAAVDLKDDDGRTPLLMASRHGHEAVVKLLLDNGAAVDGEYTDGSTPLYWASKKGHEGVVKLLLHNGAAVNARSIDGWTPLRIAVVKGLEAVVKLLLDNGAVVGVKGPFGETPLSLATRLGQEAIVRLLQSRGAT